MLAPLAFGSAVRSKLAVGKQSDAHVYGPARLKSVSVTVVPPPSTVVVVLALVSVVAAFLLAHCA